MTWRVALIDSLGLDPAAVNAAAFVGAALGVQQRPPVPDPTGHGTTIAAVLARASRPFDLLLGQVFTESAVTTPAAVAAAIDWALAHGATLIHLSLGLAEDREVLSHAVARAVPRCVVVASTPARGGPVYPARYAGVIRATGDARCAPGECSVLEAGLFGGCPQGIASGHGPRVSGASIGAAWVSQAILSLPRASTQATLAALQGAATYVGRERRGAPGAGPTG